MDHFGKVEPNKYKDLLWNVPEKKYGTVNIIGGNMGNFRTEIKIAELLDEEYPLQSVNIILPDSLESKLPPLPNFIFLPSTDSGSFDDSQSLYDIFNTADFNLALGDYSKNSITGKAVANACKSSEKMTLITRDGIEALIDNNPEKVIMNENLIILASVAQLSKLLRTIYYPKMLLASQSLMQVTDVLHKFTLSYPVSVITLHDGQIVVTKNGNVEIVPLAKTKYSPLTIWSGEFAAKIVAMNLYNPNQFIGSSIAALLDRATNK